MAKSNPQLAPFKLLLGALGYRTRSDPTATAAGYLVGGSQNVLINESNDDGGDKVETRAGYEMLGAESTERSGIKNEMTFKTKAGNSLLMRFVSNGDLEVLISGAWELLMDGLNGDYNCRFTTVWAVGELIRQLLFVNHSDSLYSWSGALGTLVSVASGSIVINESIGDEGFLTALSGRSIRIKDAGGTWRSTVYTNQSGSAFTVSTDLTAYTFPANALVMQDVAATVNTPADGFINDCIRTVENHVYVGSHASSVVYMSKSTDFTDFTFSSPRIATDGWQFVLDDFVTGFETNIVGADGKESLVMFAGNDWIYRVQFIDIADATIAQVASVKPIIVSSGQGAVSQELIAKMGNSIVFLNAYNELLELGSIENITTPQQTPLSDPIRPDFIAADFTGGNIRFWRNNLVITAAAAGRMFILSFRQSSSGTRAFWQPPQLLPAGQLSDYLGDLIGHSPAVTESYTLFTGTNDNGKPISFKMRFAYNNYGAREKLKNFIKYFTEMFLTSNSIVTHTLVFEYLGAKKMQSFTYKGTELQFLYTPNPSASLGVPSLGTSPLGAYITEADDYLKYRRFKKIIPTDFFEMQCWYESEELDTRFQLLCHGPDVGVSKNAPVAITS